jgi:hypothetical protein
VDWEFFGVTHPGREIGAFASHIRAPELEGEHSTAPLGPIQRKRIRIRNERCGTALVEAYLQTAGEGITSTPMFRRGVLCAWGRESVSAANYWQEWLTDARR